MRECGDAGMRGRGFDRQGKGVKYTLLLLRSRAVSRSDNAVADATTFGRFLVLLGRSGGYDQEKVSGKT